jgi:biotin carboxyl carrier protein
MGSKVKTHLLSPRTAELYKFMKKPSEDSKQNDLIATITGLIKEIKVTEGETINKAQSLVILEAMKMENTLISPIDGIAKKINFKKGDTVLSGDVLIEIEEKN